MRMKMVKIAAQWIFILCIPVLLLSASLGIAANCPWLYKYGFEKYEVGRTTGLPDIELEKVAKSIINYFNSSEKDLYVVVEKNGQPFVLFNDREVAHMRDVKGLFRLDYYLLVGTLIYAIAFILLNLLLWKDRRRLAQGLFGGGVLTLGLMAALGLGALLDFESLFLQFHLISFDNYLWQLNPATDYLIRLFPQGFYYDATIFCAIGTGAGAVILGGIGWWQMRKSNRPLSSPNT